MTTTDSPAYIDRLNRSSAALLFFNLVPLLGVFWLGWSVGEVVLLYWFENLVIGVLNVLKMITSQGAASQRAPKFFIIPFFCFHYFFFCAGHGVFVVSLFGDSLPFETSGGMIDTLILGFSLFVSPYGLAAAGLALSHGISLMLNYFGGGEYRTTDVNKLMQQPYGRIFVLHITIILGGVAIQALGAPIGLLLLFIAVKIFADLMMHRREHRPK